MRCESSVVKAGTSGWRCAFAALAAVVGLSTSFASAAGPAEATTQRVVPVAEQRARDSDRVEVLRQELNKSEDLLASLARRKAERLAAADAKGAAEAEDQHSRTLNDVAALKRELGAAANQAGQTDAEASPTKAVKASVRAAAPAAMKTPAPPAAPWWDVYGRERTPTPPAASPTPISQAPASSAAPIPVSGRRLE